jgi:DNA-binding transcriptional ArsR family regulator
MSLPAVSKHLKVLEHAGLIARGREAQWRPCRIELNALKGVDDWLEEYRRLWEQRLDRLEDYLRTLQSETPRDKAETKKPEKKRGRRK